MCDVCNILSLGALRVARCGHVEGLLERVVEPCDRSRPKPETHPSCTALDFAIFPKLCRRHVRSEERQ